MPTLEDRLTAALLSNVARIRSQRGNVEVDLIADRLSAITGETWSRGRTYALLSGRRGRTVAWVEVVALARALQTTVLELVTPSEDQVALHELSVAFGMSKTELSDEARELARSDYVRRELLESALASHPEVRRHRDEARRVAGEIIDSGTDDVDWRRAIEPHLEAARLATRRLLYRGISAPDVKRSETLESYVQAFSSLEYESDLPTLVEEQAAWDRVIYGLTPDEADRPLDHLAKHDALSGRFDQDAMSILTELGLLDGHEVGA